jgi:predicted  nucleic acid-binding Zn-ribbon protein
MNKETGVKVFATLFALMFLSATAVNADMTMKINVDASSILGTDIQVKWSCTTGDSPCKIYVLEPDGSSHLILTTSGSNGVFSYTPTLVGRHTFSVKNKHNVLIQTDYIMVQSLPVSNSSGEIDALWQNASNQQNQINNLQTNASGQQTQINTLFSNASAQSGQIHNQQHQIDSQQSQINTLKINASVQQTQINNLNTDVFIINNKLTNVIFDVNHLRFDLNVETWQRQWADNWERGARIAGDQNLQNQIDDLNQSLQQEVQDRKDADAQIANSLNGLSLVLEHLDNRVTKLESTLYTNRPYHTFGEYKGLYDLPKPANEVEKERFNPSTDKITLTWEALNGIVKEKESNLTVENCVVVPIECKGRDWNADGNINSFETITYCVAEPFLDNELTKFPFTVDTKINCNLPKMWVTVKKEPTGRTVYELNELKEVSGSYSESTFKLINCKFNPAKGFGCEKQEIGGN